MPVMSRIVLAIIAALFLSSSLVMEDSPACRMSDLAQAASAGHTDPDPNRPPPVSIDAVCVHVCSCTVLLLTSNLLDSAAANQALLPPAYALWPQLAVTPPLTPPPRLV